MKKQTIIVLLLCLIPLLSLWAGGKTDSTPTAATSTAPVTLDVWIYPSINEAGPPPPDWQVPIVMKQRLNIDLKFTIMPSNNADWDTKIMATAAANNLPDFFEVRRAPWENLVK
ncbi:MAG: ABC transporter substrate-binding protein, partial [Treponema sp.]|nr:ABC transporter substrate-binding protein [Treponema sp.]